MSFLPDSKTFLEIGIFSIKWYAVLIMTGVLLCCWVAYKELKKNGYGVELVEDLFVGCLLWGIVGARLWFCAFYDFQFYFSNPIELLKVFEGGLAIQGGLFAGAGYALYYCHKKKISFMRGADCVVPPMLIAQALGRWGNFVNQEAFGGVVQESFYRYYPEFIKSKMFIEGAYREPTFLYESVGNLVGFVLIWFVYRKSKSRNRGDLAYAYLLWYGLIRFFVEGQRTDSLMFGPIRMAQLISILFMVAGALGIFGVFRKLFKKEKPVILFDLDGTLVDTEPAIIETYRRLFIKYRTEEEFDREKQLAVLGPTLQSMFVQYFPNEDVEQLLEEYRSINREIHAEFVRPMENAKALLDTLEKQGYKMAIVSTKKQEMVRFGLSLFDMEKYFEVILGEGDVEKMKPAPDGIFEACKQLNEGHDSCIYVGDSATDIEAAHRAGVFSIGYLFNPERKQILVDSNPNRIISDLKEIEEILKEDHPWTYNMM